MLNTENLVASPAGVGSMEQATTAAAICNLTEAASTSPGDRSGTHQALLSALALILRPIVRVLLRHSVPFQAFEDVARQVYVQSACDDFAMPGRKATAARAAVLTGLSRKEVQRRLHAERAEGEWSAESTERLNRASVVVTGWLQDGDFRNDVGQPRRLQMEGEDGFAALVKRYSGDMPPRAVLDELVRIGAVERHPDGSLALLQRGELSHSQQSPAELLNKLGRDVAVCVSRIGNDRFTGPAA